MLKGRNDRGDEGITGVKCDFVFTNLDLNRSYQLAQNAQVEGGYMKGRSWSIGQLTDSDGHIWKLVEHKGLSSVACSPVGTPASIVHYITGGTHIEAFNSSGGVGGLTADGEKDAAKWTGGFDTIEPGKSFAASLVFSVLQYNFNVPYPEPQKSVSSFRLESQFVVGAVEPGGKEKDIKYSLERLVLDKITVPAAGNSAGTRTKSGE
jgi:hypothetical protein